MAGSLYIWIMLGFFVLVVGVILLLMGAFWVGHMIEKKETGATHGFLELPHELRPSAGGAKADDGQGELSDRSAPQKTDNSPPPAGPAV